MQNSLNLTQNNTEKVKKLKLIKQQEERKNSVSSDEEEIIHKKVKTADTLETILQNTRKKFDTLLYFIDKSNLKYDGWSIGFKIFNFYIISDVLNSIGINAIYDSGDNFIIYQNNDMNHCYAQYDEVGVHPNHIEDIISLKEEDIKNIEIFKKQYDLLRSVAAEYSQISDEHREDSILGIDGIKYHLNDHDRVDIERDNVAKGTKDSILLQMQNDIIDQAKFNWFVASCRTLFSGILDHITKSKELCREIILFDNLKDKMDIKPTDPNYVEKCKKLLKKFPDYLREQERLIAQYQVLQLDQNKSNPLNTLRPLDHGVANEAFVNSFLQQQSNIQQQLQKPLKLEDSIQGNFQQKQEQQEFKNLEEELNFLRQFYQEHKNHNFKY